MTLASADRPILQPKAPEAFGQKPVERPNPLEAKQRTATWVERVKTTLGEKFDRFKTKFIPKHPREAIKIESDIDPNDPAKTVKEIQQAAETPMKPLVNASEITKPSEFDEVRSEFRTVEAPGGEFSFLKDLPQELVQEFLTHQPWRLKGAHVEPIRQDGDRLGLTEIASEKFIIKTMGKTEKEIEALRGKPEYRRELLSNTPLAQIAIVRETQQRYMEKYGEELPVEEFIGFFRDRDTTENYMIYRYQESIKLDPFSDFGDKVIEQAPRVKEDIYQRLDSLGILNARTSDHNIVETSNHPDGFQGMLTNTESWRIKGEYENKENRDPSIEITTTSPEQLILGEQKTAETVVKLREAVAQDPILIQRRNRMLADFSKEGGELVTQDGKEYMVLYRGIRPGWDVATTAAGFCKRTSNDNHLRNALDNLNDYQEASSNGTPSEWAGNDLFNKLAGGHIAESLHSLLIPTSMTREYAENFHNADQLGTLLKITVPLEYAVPIYQYAEAYLSDSFKREREIGIVGKIEPEWVKILPEDKTEKRRDLQDMKKVSETRGTNPGGVYRDQKTDETFYVKEYEDPAQSACEYIANRVYSLCNIPVLEGQIVQNGESIAYATPYRSDLTNLPEDQRTTARQMFVAASYLADWDAVGTGPENPYGNLQQGSDGNMILVDHGGALLFRGLQGRKDIAMLPLDDIPELTTMRSDINPLSKRVFSDITDAEIAAQTQTLVNILTDPVINSIVDRSGIPDSQEATFLKEFLIRRREALRRKYIVDKF